jgi:hypothetical protein
MRRDYLGDISIDGRIILKWVLENRLWDKDAWSSNPTSLYIFMAWCESTGTALPF